MPVSHPNVYVCLLFLFFVGNEHLWAQSQADMLRQVAMDETEVDTVRLWALDSLALKVYQNQPDSALYYARLQFQLAESVDNKRWMGIGEQRIGIAYHYQGDLTQALDHYKRSMVWMEATGNRRGVAATLINIGMQYGGKGDFTQSQAYTLKGLKIAEEIGDSELEANALGRLGTINYHNGNTEEAKDYFFRAYRTNKESGINRGLLASSSVNLGAFLAAEGEYEDGLTYTLQAAEIFEELDQLYGLADAYGTLGYIYGETGDQARELTYHQLGLEVSQKMGNEQKEAVDLANLGVIYMDRKDYPQAITHFSQALNLAQKIGDLKSSRDIAQKLYVAYKSADKYQVALEMQDLWIKMRDSLNQEEQAKELLKQQFKFEQEKKDAIAKEEIARQNLQRNASLVGLGLVGMLAAVLFQNGRRRRKTNQLLTAQKAEIEAKSQQNELLLKEIHHRVKNNLQTISSLLFLQSAHIQDEDVKQAVAAGQHRVESMALIHQKLYQKENLAAVEMKDYLHNLTNSLVDTFGYQPERIQVHIDMEELELDVDTAVPLGLIVNELITNSLKYAFPDGRKGKITVNLAQQADGKLELQVADDGIGAANTERGTSFGSQLIQLLTQQLGGTIEQSAEDGYWTKIVV